MWILNFIPDWVFHFCVVIGLAGVIGSSLMNIIPMVSNYRHMVGLIGGVLFTVGVFMEGYIYGQQEMRDQIAVFEQKLKEAEEKASIVNEKVVTQYKTQIVKIKENTNEVIKYVDKYIDAPIDNKYPVPNAFVVLHDSASQNQLPPSASGAYEGTSDIKISEVARTVTENYGTCYGLREQVKAWQQWYTEQKNIFDNIAN